MIQIPENITQNWDVIVVGTGIGGATLGHALARTGRQVLFLEQGRSYLGNPEAYFGDYAEMFFPKVAVPDDSHREILVRSGRWSGYLEDSSYDQVRKHIPFIGSGSGGSSALFGAAMERFFYRDFLPRSCYPDEKEADLPETWPIDYQDLVSFYRQAEQLYRVRGDSNPLREDSEDFAGKPAPGFSPASKSLAEFLEDKGLHPYRMPTACEFVPGCQTCQGFLCPKNCKNDSAKTCLIPAIKKHGAQLLEQCRVVRLDANKRRITTIICEFAGSTLKLSGTTVILAAGALATPVILLRSTSPQWPNGLANRSGLVGRYLMRHCIDLYAISPIVKPAPEENTKELAFTDFYHQNGRKLGAVQAFGRLPPAPLLVESVQHDLREQRGPVISSLFQLIKPAARIALKKMLGDTMVLATTLEDLPFRDNHVLPIGKERFGIRYRLDKGASKRIEQFRQITAETLKPLRYNLIKQAENNDRIAHACGTCRFGRDPRTSVLDPTNRAHDIENLYVVDSSFFPSSAGISPSLTIAANALRVATHLSR